MAIVAHFETPGMTVEQYEQTLKKLEEAGLGSPDGRIYHVASPIEGGWSVTDVWESEEKLGAFGDALMPILSSTGVTPTQPKITQVHTGQVGSGRPRKHVGPSPHGRGRHQRCLQAPPRGRIMNSACPPSGSPYAKPARCRRRRERKVIWR